MGAVSDFFGGRRACVIAVCMMILAPLMYFFSNHADTLEPAYLLVILGVMGVLVGGPNNIITSAVAADLSEHDQIKGNAKALGTVTGVINGSGSIIAALGLLLIGPIQVNYGWSYVWTFLVLCVIVGTLILVPRIVKELSSRVVL